MAATAPPKRDFEELQDRLYHETPFWAENCAYIIDAGKKKVRLVPNEPQLRFDAALEGQRAAGKPMRALVLKARKMGFSTWVQAKIQHRITQREHRRALVIGQNKKTAAELFEMGETIHANLPTDPDLALKPSIAARERGKLLYYGETSRLRREEGIFGLDSKLEVDTANEVDAGRGFTYSELHCSEVAFWPDPRKLTALLNAVPEDPDTMVVLESTANGSNFFKLLWEQAENGESDYIPFFAAWHEFDAYRRPFKDKHEREEFAQSVGEGPWGEDEPRLQSEFGCDLEQLNWRRWTIMDPKIGGDLQLFKQEYPASPEEAFISSGQHVFSMTLVSRVLDRTRKTDPKVPSNEWPGPERGIFEPGKTFMRKSRTGLIEVPADPIWKPKFETGYGDLHPFWRIWQHPTPGHEPQSAEDEARPPGAYVVAIDPSSGREQTDSGDYAYHAIQVIDHRTRMQVAEYRSRIDPDLIAREALLVALYYNRAWIAPETTGGYGLSIARKLWRGFGYPLVYRRKSLEKAMGERQEDRLGWDTSRVTKQVLEDGMREILREGTKPGGNPPGAGINSHLLATEFTTYVMDENGKTGPEPDAFADLLMAYLIAQQVAQEKPIPKPSSTSSTGKRRFQPRNPIVAY